jgi:hypothetical protein
VPTRGARRGPLESIGATDTPLTREDGRQEPSGKEAARKLIYLAIINAQKSWRQTYNAYTGSRTPSNRFPYDERRK